MNKFKRIKKVELHCHLDGSLNLDLASTWSKLEKSELKKLLVASKSTKSLTDYLEKFDYPIKLLQTKTHLKEAAKTLALDMKDENVIYAEIRFAPLNHIKKGLTLEEVVDATLDGLNSSGLKSNLILTMKREESLTENKRIIDLAKKYLNKGVCAVDLAGDESKYPTENYRELFAYAKEKKVPFTIHAGEGTDASNIDAAISFGASRIGHGIRAIKSFKTMEMLKRNDVVLEICPSSNIDTNIFPSFAEHPVGRLIDSGVSVTINTDNRTVSNTNLSKEYELLNEFLGFEESDFFKLNLVAIEHAYISEEEKNMLIEELKK